MVRRSSLALTALAALLAAALLAAAWWGLRPRSAPLAAGLSLAEAMGGGAEGYLRAVEPRPFSFPTDHGPHPGFRTEWWYFTGNLSGPEGEAYGFHLTFFRSALRPPAARSEGDSAWRADDLYMAHFALADERGGRFRHAERFARAAIGLAGAESAPLRVWLEDWSAAAEPDAGPEGIPPLRLRAREGASPSTCASSAASPPSSRATGGSRRRAPSPATPPTTIRSPACRRAARSPSTGARSRSPAAPGWTASGRRARWARRSRAGTGSRSSSTTAAT
ncbi:MAG: carotenoid 1,2-hydratase [Thermoanaerobaculia bacterium]|nr:carotenoid 1,2-hydratase [Thermoanaerobaculia bacterium]